MDQQFCTLTEQFYFYALNDVCQSYQLEKEYIEFVKEAHGPHQRPIKCCTMVFYENLKNFFNDDSKSLTEKIITLFNCAQKMKTFSEIYSILKVLVLFLLKCRWFFLKVDVIFKFH